jgi:hypothetical protein
LHLFISLYYVLFGALGEDYKGLRGLSELPKAVKATAQGAAQFEDSDALAESRTPTLA